MFCPDDLRQEIKTVRRSRIASDPRDEDGANTREEDQEGKGNDDDDDEE